MDLARKIRVLGVIRHDRADATQGSSDVFLQHNAQQIGIQSNTVNPGVQLVLTFSHL